MIPTDTTLLEQARDEIITFTQNLDEKKARGELRGLEYKIALHEKMHGKDKDELLHHISHQITQANEHTASKKNKATAIMLTTALLLLAIAAAPFMQWNATGFGVIEQNHAEHTAAQERIAQQENCTQQDWDGQASGTPPRLTPEENSGRGCSEPTLQQNNNLENKKINTR